MIFNSWEYFVFLPLVLILYYVFNRRAQNIWLLVASYFFFFFWDWRVCSLLLISTLVDFVCGLSMGRHPSHKRAWLIVSMVTNLGILGFFKYFNFFVDTAGMALAALGLEPNLPALRIILPVGISFYTFQTMSYTIDVYRGQLVPTRSFLDFALYVAYFPQLVAGPIERATHLLKQFASPRVVTRPMVETGCFLILLGLFRKVVIADGVAPMVNAVFANAPTSNGMELCMGTVLFAFQIYCDFAGYSDMARGTSRLLGIELMVNFNQPYFSRNITEFWRRWHISLSTWLRDYLYIPLGGNQHGTVATYRNLFLTMLLGGLWHGARWNFVVWGGLHGLYLAVHKLWMVRHPTRDGSDLKRRFGLGDMAGMLITFFIVNLAWIFFRSTTLADALGVLQGIASFRGGLDRQSLALGVKLMFYGGLVVAIDLPCYLHHRHEQMLEWCWLMRALVYSFLLFLLILLRPLDDMPFIYFQF